MTTRDIGNAGEQRAADYLQQKGYTLLARNYTVRGGELDIVAADGKTLVFAEVKTRASSAFGGPVAAVTPTKQKRIALAAIEYIKENGLKFDSIRFDVLCVWPDTIEHIENAFVPSRTNL